MTEGGTISVFQGERVLVMKIRVSGGRHQIRGTTFDDRVPQRSDEDPRTSQDGVSGVTTHSGRLGSPSDVLRFRHLLNPNL